MKSAVYIDGLNLYYGAIRGTRHKWLNIQRLFERLRPHDDIQVIRYFSALVQGPHQANQRTYLRALETCPKVDVILGKFKNKRFTCRVQTCSHKGPRIYTGTEEKRTDVAIGVRLIDDAYCDLADQFIIVSGDSDLVPAISLLKDRFPKKRVIVYVPSRHKVRGAAVELRGAGDSDRDLPQLLIERSQFPPSLPDGAGGTIRKPSDW